MSYLGSAPSNQTPTYKQVYEYTATAGQTSFAASYTVGFVEVYRNGVKLGSTDFTATTGTTVVLASGATAGDFVQVVSLFINATLSAIPNTAGAVATANIADANVTTAKIADGNVTATKIASGQIFSLNGIAFPATQVSSADANTLDDYEEGTFTLTWFSGANGTGTNLGQSTGNKYVKIGRFVSISFFRGVGSGNCLSFTGLPFIPNIDGAATTITADSAILYYDGSYPTACSYRGTGDGIYSRGTINYQTT